jgi:hypothetical protein
MIFTGENRRNRTKTCPSATLFTTGARTRASTVRGRRLTMIIVRTLTAVCTMLRMSWVLAPFGFVGRWQRFGEKYCVRRQGWSDKAGKWMAYIGLEEGRQKCVKFSLEISSIIMELNV